MHNLGYPITESQVNLNLGGGASPSALLSTVCKKGSAGESADDLHATPNVRARGITVGSPNTESCPSIGPFSKVAWGTKAGIRQ